MAKTKEIPQEEMVTRRVWLPFSPAHFEGVEYIPATRIHGADKLNHWDEYTLRSYDDIVAELDFKAFEGRKFIKLSTNAGGHRCLNKDYIVDVSAVKLAVVKVFNDGNEDMGKTGAVKTIVYVLHEDERLDLKNDIEPRCIDNLVQLDTEGFERMMRYKED